MEQRPESAVEVEELMATKTFKISDNVSWNSPQGKVTGSINK